jgi:hypothetical protein
MSDVPVAVNDGVPVAKPRWRPRWRRIALAGAGVALLWAWSLVPSAPRYAMRPAGSERASDFCLNLAQQIPGVVRDSPAGARGVRVIDVFNIVGDTDCEAEIDMNTSRNTALFGTYSRGGHSFISLQWLGPPP